MSPLRLRLSDRLALHAASAVFKWRPTLRWPQRRFQLGQKHESTWPLLLDPSVRKALDEIPSETTRAERWLLFSYFRYVWPGDGDVLEIGPFLGGTTRAMGLAMLGNPRRSAVARLVTCDRFGAYGGASYLVATAEPLIERGLLTRGEARALTVDGGFLALFQRLHASQAYYPFLEIVSSPLPDSVSGAAGPGVFRVDAGRQFSAIFVDGAKSWFATKYLLSELAPATRPGAIFALQDYGHYTCFWLAAILGILKEYFQLLWYADCTYFFVLTRPLDREVIGDRVVNDPAELDQSDLESLFGELIEIADERGDNHAWVRHHIHLTGALAWIGKQHEARRVLAKLATSVRAVGHENAIQEAWRRPTYKQGDGGADAAEWIELE